MATLVISSVANLALGFGLNLLFRPDLPDVTQEGPRLGDLTLATSSYGTPIPIHEGSVRTAVNYIWSPKIKEVVNTERTEAGGKGGGGGGSVTTTTYSYFSDFAVDFGEGVAKDVLKIWANSKLIFDKTAGGLTSSKYKFRFYKGDEDQLADPLIEAAEGAGTVPAFRGTCYLVGENWPLADFGNGRPNITALIAYEATETAPFTPLTEIPSYVPPVDSGNFIQLDPDSSDFYTFGTGGLAGIARASLSDMTAQVGEVGSLNGVSSIFGTDGFVYSQPTNINNWTSMFKYDPVSFEVVGQLGGVSALCSFELEGCTPNGISIGVLGVGGGASALAGLTRRFFVVITANSIVTNGGNVKVAEQIAGNFFLTQVFTDITTALGGPANVIQDSFNDRVFIVQNDTTQAVLYRVDIPTGFNATGIGTGPISLTLVGTYLKDGSQLSGAGAAIGDCLLPAENALIMSNGTSMIKIDLEDGAVLANNTTLGFLSHQQWATDGVFAFSRGGASTDLVTIDTDDLTETASQSVTLTGLGAEPANARPAYDPRNHSLVYARLGAVTDRVVRVLLDRRDADGVDLSSVVSRILQRLDVAAADLDLSALSGLTVRGYTITRPMAGRSALEPLQATFLFDIVESDFKLKAVLRGGAPVLTIPEDDIGLLDDNRDPLAEEQRLHEEEMPLSSVIRYLDIDGDYQQNAQTERRIREPTSTQNAQSTIILDLAIVLNATEAKQLAQKVLYTRWGERAEISNGLTLAYILLDPADVIELTRGGEIRRVRLEQIELGADLEINFRAVQEDARSSQSDLAGDTGGFIRSPVPSQLPTKLLPLDMPLLSASDASFQSFVRGYYAFAAFDDGWPGGILYQSRDDGATFTELSAASVEATYGVTKVIIADPGNTATWDETSTVTLSVQRGISRFVSSTDTEVLNGANALIVVGNNGPEIIQFVDVTQVDASTVVLSRLLRGRRGTEPNAAGHILGERFVLLEPGRIFRFDLALSFRNLLLEYRAVTLGTALEEAPRTIQAYTGQDLLPYSVSQLAATRPGGTDFQATWVKRTRFGGELLDGTGEAPLNESLEEYDVETLLNGTLVDSKTVDTPVYDLTNAELLAAGFVDGQFPFFNADLEQSTGWTLFGSQYVASAEGILPQQGSQMVWFGGGTANGTVEALTQSVRLSDIGYDTFEQDNRAARPSFTLRYYENTADAGDFMQVVIEFREENENILGSIDTGLRAPALDSWVQVVPAAASLPVGTRKIRMRVLVRASTGFGPANVFIDNVQCSLDTGISPITTRVWQKSAIVGRGRLKEEIL